MCLSAQFNLLLFSPGTNLLAFLTQFFEVSMTLWRIPLRNISFSPQFPNNNVIRKRPKMKKGLRTGEILLVFFRKRDDWKQKVVTRLHTVSCKTPICYFSWASEDKYLVHSTQPVVVLGLVMTSRKWVPPHPATHSREPRGAPQNPEDMST